MFKEPGIHQTHRFQVLIAFSFTGIIVLACNFYSTRKKVNLILILLIGLILGLQIGYLMPKLDARISLIQQGMKLHSSSLHFYYVAGEILKISFLLILGTRVVVSLTKHRIAGDY